MGDENPKNKIIRQKEQGERLCSFIFFCSFCLTKKPKPVDFGFDLC
ncbi:hypothetical protein HMPREF0072_1522 [Anaerococcus lactolyticus ATCC 51172]|uniref:Uncharacterized protein n=1 Tax=Anaerococcus lactolyticus ATCC 51172 TaxID=525254 RepID=C2BGQ2_9FIRM|nr:hypothetical protein HMPREF0072_1522 [Anaerococcus lactolyticus ATCC 51172]